ncbi:HD-GYP domain-containing protein [Sphingomonas paucimobilis]|uniref:HD-GYP domain-containing protein n=1 Tax=Sphingomonas paucimobilis TaxID=13689 RepID=UPI0028CFDC8B|nr:HD-GYP domain-containing protein [Sphingomonas paucimobilis]
MTDRSDPNRYLRIEGRQAELGMYIHALHCSWLDNPFWRSSFLMVEPSDRAQIHASVPHITIDLTKGRGLTLAAAITSEEIPAPAATVARIRPRRRKPRTDTEMATALAEHATATVSRLYREARLGHSVHVPDLAPVVEEIAQFIAKGSATMLAVTRLKDGDQYTYIHSVAVATLMMGLARHLGLGKEDIRVAGMAGLLHDIGKMQVAPAIVDKAGKLTINELAEMRQHPRWGYDILVGIEDLDPRIVDVCRHHHEKMDGTGYPDGLTGEQLSVFVRMSAICDVYDAVTSIRPYKRAWSPHEALARMAGWQGHLDPEMLRAFVASLGIQPYGALVRLHSNRLGLVVRESDCPQTPIVRTFFHVPDQQPLPPEDVATSTDPILRAERGDYWFGERWPSLHAEIMALAALPDPPRRRQAGGNA